MVPFTFLLLFGVTAAIALTSSSPCEGNSNCKCVRQLPNSYQVACSKPLDKKLMFNADYQPGTSFQIQCKSPDDTDFSLLKGLNIGSVKSFGLRFCPLPKTTLKELMKTVQISEVTEIDLKPNFEVKDGLPSSLFEGLESVTKISLNNIGLTSLPENLFDGVPKLVSVFFWSNNLKSIPRHLFSKTPHLEAIELSSNHLANFEPGVFQNLSHLKVLTLQGNRLVNLTRSIFVDVPNLENLDLRSNGLNTLPQDIFTDLVKLSTLNLNHNAFTHLPNGLFKSTPSLERLELAINGKLLQTLPNGFLSHLTMLREVNIGQSGISTLPEDLLWNSPNISRVSFEGNLLTKLPEALFRDAKELRSVDFSYNKLESLPDFLFSSSTKLREVKLLYNNLQTISSQTFRGLSKLIILNLEDNKLNHIGKDAFASLESLIFINLSNNNLTFIDSSDVTSGPLKSPLQYCRRLETIQLANNRIQHVFEDWKLLPSLRTLDLGYNNIKTITKEDLFFASKKLIVDFNHNEITTVNLQDIERFAVNQTRIQAGVNHENQRKSTQIRLGDNPIVCDCSIYDLVRYHEGALAPEVRSFIDIDIEVTKCVGPAPMQRIKVSNLNSKDLNCASDQVADSPKPVHAHSEQTQS